VSDKDIINSDESLEIKVDMFGVLGNAEPLL